MAHVLNVPLDARLYPRRPLPATERLRAAATRRPAQALRKYDQGYTISSIVTPATEVPMDSSFARRHRRVWLACLALVLLAACSTARTATVAPTQASASEAAPVEETEAQPAEESTDEEAPAEEPVQPEPTATPLPTEVLPTATPAAETAPTAMPTATLVPTGTPTASPAAGGSPPLAVAPRAPASVAIELTRIPDTDPAPPLSIAVHTIRREETGRTRLTGTIRNDSGEIYESAAVRASFVDSDGLGSGSIEVHVPCPFLEPGQECAFIVDTYLDNLVAYRLHPAGHPLRWGNLTPITVRARGVSTDGLGNVRITGTATNDSAFTVRTVIVVGTLYDRSGLVASTDWDLVSAELAPGASAPFDVRIEYRPYASYQLLGQAIRD